MVSTVYGSHIPKSTTEGFAVMKLRIPEDVWHCRLPEQEGCEALGSRADVSLPAICLYTTLGILTEQ